MDKKRLFTTTAALLTLAAVSIVLLLDYKKQNNRASPATIEVERVYIDSHNAEHSLDYWGTYTGTLPDTNSLATQIVLALTKENQFQLTMSHLEKGDTLNYQGEYTVSGNLLTLIGESTDYYRIGENRLIKLDSNKQPITDELANHYLLTKIQ